MSEQGVGEAGGVREGGCGGGGDAEFTDIFVMNDDRCKQM